MSDTERLVDEPNESRVVRDSDWAMVQRAQRGDKMAFEQLVFNNQRGAFNIAYHYFHNIEDAKDLAQDAFLQVHRKLHTFRGEAPFAVWLNRIVTNLCKNRSDYLKRRGGSRNDSLSGPVGGERSELIRDLPDPKSNALEELSKRQLDDLVREEMKAVDGEYQAVLIFRDVEERTYEDIAQILDVPIGTVKSRLHRGRTELLARIRRRLGIK